MRPWPASNVVILNGNPAFGLSRRAWVHTATRNCPRWRWLIAPPNNPSQQGLAGPTRVERRVFASESLALLGLDLSGQAPQHLVVTWYNTRRGLLQVELKKCRPLAGRVLGSAQNQSCFVTQKGASAGGTGVSQYVYIFDKCILARMALLNQVSACDCSSFKAPTLPTLGAGAEPGGAVFH